MTRTNKTIELWPSDTDNIHLSWWRRAIAWLLMVACLSAGLPRTAGAQEKHPTDSDAGQTTGDDAAPIHQTRRNLEGNAASPSDTVMLDLGPSVQEIAVVYGAIVGGI